MFRKVNYNKSIISLILVLSIIIPVLYPIGNIFVFADNTLKPPNRADLSHLTLNSVSKKKDATSPALYHASFSNNALGQKAIIKSDLVTDDTADWWFGVWWYCAQYGKGFDESLNTLLSDCGVKKVNISRAGWNYAREADTYGTLESSLFKPFEGQFKKGDIKTGFSNSEKSNRDYLAYKQSGFPDGYYKGWLDGADGKTKNHEKPKKLSKSLWKKYKSHYIADYDNGYTGGSGFGKGAAQQENGVDVTNGTEGKGNNKDKGYKIENNGKVRDDVSEIYSQMENFPSLFDNTIDYLDIAIPYKANATQIGGKAANYSPSKIHYMGTHTSVEYDSWATGASNMVTVCNTLKGVTKNIHGTMKPNGKKDESSGSVLTVTDKNGVQYILTAVQPFFIGYEKGQKPDGVNVVKKVKKKVPHFIDSTSCGDKGTFFGVFDMIFKDGTVVHCIQVDINSVEHTNGGTSNSGVKLKQYSNIYGGTSANQPEIWGANGLNVSTTFSNITNLGKNNPIAYYRLYNIDMGRINKSNKSHLSDNAIKSWCHNVESEIDDSDAGGGGNSSSDDSKDGSSEGSSSVRLDETSYVSQNVMKEVMLEFTDRDDLSEDELYNLSAWEEDIKGDGLVSKIINSSRKLVAVAGILIIIWMVLIYLAFWFDRINNFLDIELLPIITFNKLIAAPEDDIDCNFNSRDLARGEKRTVNNMVIIRICIVGIIFGVILISGVIYKIIYGMITLGQNIVSKYF